MDQPELSDTRIVQPEFPSCRVEMMKILSFRASVVEVNICETYTCCESCGTGQRMAVLTAETQ